MANTYTIINRQGEVEFCRLSKIESRIIEIASMEPKLTKIDIIKLSQRVIASVKDGIKTSELDELTASLAANNIYESPEYMTFAARILTSSLHKDTTDSFSEKIEKLWNHKIYSRVEERYIDAPLIRDEFASFVAKHAAELDAMIDYDRDYDISYLGVRTLKSGYLLCELDDNCDKKIVERPQDVFMRAAVGIYLHGSLDEIKKHYDGLSLFKFMHATPTLYNAGTLIGQYSSCFLLGSEDSIPAIFKTIADCALISKTAGGIGVHNSYRAAGSYIRGTNGFTSGKVPFMKVFSATAEAVDQGGGKRPGSIAFYEFIHDADIEVFLNLNKLIDIDGDGSKDNNKKQTIFTGLWISDLFIKRLNDDGIFSLFSRDECPLLWDTWGEKYEAIYISYERRGLYRSQIRARKLYESIFSSQIQSSKPYILLGDNANRFSNQQNLGTIKSSNLCTEIIIYSDIKEYGTCNLASICLASLVKDARKSDIVQDARKSDSDQKKGSFSDEFPIEPYFDFEELIAIIARLVAALNNVIDKTTYPVEEAKNSNLKHRPIGIGVQGLADVFFKFKIPYDSEPARLLNKQIFETMYYAALKESCRLAMIDGAYSSFAGSPLSKGIFRWEMSGLTKDDLTTSLNWDALRFSIKKFGTRNSLHIALMPTASTGDITGQSECFAPRESNVLAKNRGNGTFMIINKYLMNDLASIGMLDEDILATISEDNGSLRSIEGIPDEMKAIYKTAHEIDPFNLIEMASDRQHFIDQSQSMNIFLPEEMDDQHVIMHKGKSVRGFHSLMAKLLIYAWEKKLITANYYIRQLPPVKNLGIKRKVNLKKLTPEEKAKYLEGIKRKLEYSIIDNDCLSCSS